MNGFGDNMVERCDKCHGRIVHTLPSEVKVWRKEGDHNYVAHTYDKAGADLALERGLIEVTEVEVISAPPADAAATAAAASAPPHGVRACTELTHFPTFKETTINGVVRSPLQNIIHAVESGYSITTMETDGTKRVDEYDALVKWTDDVRNNVFRGKGYSKSNKFGALMTVYWAGTQLREGELGLEHLETWRWDDLEKRGRAMLKGVKGPMRYYEVCEYVKRKFAGA